MAFVGDLSNGELSFNSFNGPINVEQGSLTMGSASNFLPTVKLYVRNGVVVLSLVNIRIGRAVDDYVDVTVLHEFLDLFLVNNIKVFCGIQSICGFNSISVNVRIFGFVKGFHPVADTPSKLSVSPCY